MINLLHGDCLEQMKTLEDNSVDSIVSDPPYGISFMAKKWDYDKTEDGRHYVKDCSGVWIRPGGFRRCEGINASTGSYIIQNQDRLHSTPLWELVKTLDTK